MSDILKATRETGTPLKVYPFLYLMKLYYNLPLQKYLSDLNLYGYLARSRANYYAKLFKWRLANPETTARRLCQLFSDLLLLGKLLRTFPSPPFSLAPRKWKNPR